MTKREATRTEGKRYQTKAGHISKNQSSVLVSLCSQLTVVPFFPLGRPKKDNHDSPENNPLQSPSPFNFPAMKSAYQNLRETNQKNGNPYILSISSGPSLSSVERARGYTFVATTWFRDLEDVRYYDEECEAHRKFKAEVSGLVEQPVQPPLIVFFEEEDEYAGL